MGILLSKIFDRFHKEARVLLLGLDAAGKTSLLYKLKLGELINTVPTVGFNVERVQYKKLEFTFWDIGGQDKIRRLWKYYYRNNDALIFIVDSADRDRVDLAREELHTLLKEEELRDAALLVFANKQDLPGAMSPAELSDKMGLHTLRHRQWFIQGSCCATGDGLYEGLDWVASCVNEKK